jgi:hypothetical protein
MPRRRRFRKRALTSAFIAAAGLSSMLVNGLVAAPAPAQPSTPTPAASAAPTTSAGQPDADPGQQVKSLRIVILVDESGSLSTSDVDRERSAAAVLALGEFSPRSQVAVVGFGSSDHTGQSPVDEVCPLTELSSSANQQFLLTCIQGLHRRTAAEGNGTDHVEALGQAMSIFGKPDEVGRSKVIMLLTDGQLDVRNSPQYGPDPDQRMAEANRRLDDALGDARRAGVQIWPLGFGGAVTGEALARFAAGGAQQACNRLPDSRPRARIVRSSSDTIEALFRAYASSRCARVDFSPGRRLPPRSHLDLTVHIPEISTDGSIVVLKGDPRVAVRYFDPQGNEVGDIPEFDGSRFTRSARNGSVESLHIVDPRPGDWRVHLQSGPDVKEGDVAAAAIWQGVLRSTIVVNPPIPEAGKPVDVRVRLKTRTGAISDPGQLRGLTFGARMSGPSLATQIIRLADDGAGADRQAADGEYAGRFTVPAGATGALTFVGTVDGPGVMGDEREYNTRIATGPPPLTADVAVRGGTVRPGGTVHGTVTVNNLDGLRRTLGLRLTDLDPGTLATLGPPTVTTPGPGRTKTDFTITFGPDTRLGDASGRIQLVDAASPATVYAESFVGVKVGYPKPLWQRLWWVWLLIFLAILAGLALLAYRRRALRKRRDVRGLTLLLYRDDQVVHRLRAPSRPATDMPFAVREPTGPAPRLDRPAAGERGYLARRGDAGDVIVTPPDGSVITLHRGRTAALDDGLELGFSDDRTAAARDRRRDGATADRTERRAAAGAWSWRDVDRGERRWDTAAGAGEPRVQRRTGDRRAGGDAGRDPGGETPSTRGGSRRTPRPDARRGDAGRGDDADRTTPRAPDVRGWDTGVRPGRSTAQPRGWPRGFSDGAGGTERDGDVTETAWPGSSPTTRWDTGRRGGRGRPGRAGDDGEDEAGGDDTW